MGFFRSLCAMQCFFSLSSRPHKGGTSHRRKGAFHFTPTCSPLSSLSRWGLLSLPTVGGNQKKKKKRNLGLYQILKHFEQNTLVTQNHSDQLRKLFLFGILTAPFYLRFYLSLWEMEYRPRNKVIFTSGVNRRDIPSYIFEWWNHDNSLHSPLHSMQRVNTVVGFVCIRSSWDQSPYKARRPVAVKEIGFIWLPWK